MKKSLWLLPLAVLLLFLIAGCSMSGNVFMSFDWITVPVDWSCTDPNIDVPGVVDTLNKQYEYPTEPGSYRFTYDTASDGTWVYDYTLTAHPGSLSGPGPDAAFELFLWESGPVFTQDRGLAKAGNSLAQAATATPSSSSTQTNALRADRGAFLQEPTFEYTVTRGGYTLEVRAFLLKPGQ